MSNQHTVKRSIIFITNVETFIYTIIDVVLVRLLMTMLLKDLVGKMFMPGRMK